MKWFTGFLISKMKRINSVRKDTMPLKNCPEKYRSLLRFMLLTALNLLAIVVMAVIALAGVSRIPAPRDSHPDGPTSNIRSTEKDRHEDGQVAGMNQDDAKKDEKGKDQDKSEENKKSKDKPPPPVCKDVELGPSGKQEDVVSTLSKISDIKVYDGGPKHLIICGSPENVESIKGVAQRLTDFKPPQTPKPKPQEEVADTRSVRLFFFRKARDIAAAIDEAKLPFKVKAIGDDLLLFAPLVDDDKIDDKIHEVKRWIALIDVPRPEISMLAWSVQISSKDAGSIRDNSNLIRNTVSDFNDRLQSALEQGWRYLEVERQEYDEKFFAPDLLEYLTGRYTWSPDGKKPDRAFEPSCREDEYCLGFNNLFNPIQRSLSNMLFALIAAQPEGSLNRAKDIRDRFVDCLESRQKCAGSSKKPTRSDDYLTESNQDRQRLGDGATKPLTPGRLEDSSRLENPSSCESWDYRDLYNNQNTTATRGLAFNCFRQQLNESLSRGGHLAEIRRALADFLFQYKMAQYYPRDFVPWNQAASAQALDSNLEPLIVAFNRDISVFMRFCQEKVQARKDKKTDFSSNGVVTVRVISGNPAKVDTTNQSYFQMPSVLSVGDIVKQLNAEAFKAPSVFTDNLPTNPANLVTAAILAEQRTTAKIGRNLNLEITANTLEGASASEIQVTLNSNETEKPSLLSTGDSTTSDDNLNRVSRHDTTTKVRVDSQKLFEVSSFASALQHGRSIPLIPPFVEFPYLGNLARLRLKPGTVFHRSFAIISAVIVPTAADLANRIEFSSDLEETPLLSVSLVAEKKPKEAVNDVNNDQKKTGKTKGSMTQTPTNAQTHPVTGKKQKVHYWVVTHYREGSNLSDKPVTVEDFDEKTGVKLKWQAPERAISFDILRTKSDQKPEMGKTHKYAVAKNVRVSNLSGESEDNKKDDELEEVTLPKKNIVAFSRIPKAGRNFRAFHKAKLDCIRYEAGVPKPPQPNGENADDCKTRKLSTTPIEGRPEQ